MWKMGNGSAAREIKDKLGGGGGIISISFRQAAENSTSDEITHRHSQVNKPNTCALVFAVGKFPQCEMHLRLHGYSGQLWAFNVLF